MAGLVMWPGLLCRSARRGAPALWQGWCAAVPPDVLWEQPYHKQVGLASAQPSATVVVCEARRWCERAGNKVALQPRKDGW